MPRSGSVRRPTGRRRFAARLGAFGVHVFTACGAGLALLAMVCASRSEWTWMFVWLGLALLIDGIDGTLARYWNVSETVPRWSGDVLDFVVDFTTYVFVPAFALATSGLLPEDFAIPLALGIVVTSAIYFADRHMKTADNHFRGFPALWNAIAFHLFLLRLPAVVGAGVVVLAIVLTFAPVKVIHPVRVKPLRVLNLAVLVLWSVLAIYALAWNLAPGPFAAWLCTAAAFYLLAIGLIRFGK